MTKLIVLAFFVVCAGIVPGSANNDQIAIDSAESYFQSGYLDSAIVLGERVLQSARVNSDIGDSALSSILVKVGKYRLKRGLKHKAESLFVWAKHIREENHDSASTEIAEVLMLCGMSRVGVFQQGDWKAPLKAAIRIYGDRTTFLTKEYARALTEYAVAERIVNNYDSSRTYFDFAQRVYDSLPEPLLQDRAYLLISRGHLEIYRSEYAVSRKTLTEGLALLHKSRSCDTLLLAEGYYQRGQANERMGDLDSAKADYQSSVRYWSNTVGEDDEFTAWGYFGLGVTQMFLGEYSESERQYKRALTIWTKEIGPESYEVSRCQKAMGRLYREQGRYRDAESALLTSLSSREKMGGPNHANVASSLNDLADLYEDEGKYAEAERCFRRAMTINEKLFPPGHERVVSSRYGLSLALSHQGKYDEALALLEEARKILEDKFGLSHHALATCFETIAQIYERRGFFDRAIQLRIDAISIYEAKLGETHPFLGRALVSLGKTLHQKGDESAALTAIERGYRIEKSNFDLNCRILSERDALDLSVRLHQTAALYLSCCFNIRDLDEKQKGGAADIIVSSKGIVTDEIFARHRFGESLKQPQTAIIESEYLKSLDALSALHSRGPVDNSTDSYRNQLKQLEYDVDSLEGELALYNERFRISLESSHASAKQICAITPEDAIVIEFIRLEETGQLPNTRTSAYALLALDRSGVITVERIGAAATIDSVANECLAVCRQLPSEWPDIDSSRLLSMKGSLSRLYDLTLQSIRSRLKDYRQIIVAADGILNLIPFSALVDHSGAYLIESNSVHYVSAARDLLRTSIQEAFGRGLIAFGNPDFDADNDEMRRSDGSDEASLSTENETTASWSANPLERQSSYQSPALPIPYTGREVEAINKLWRSSQSESSWVFIGTAANEGNFKNESPGKRVVHLATHGFFETRWDDSVRFAEGMTDGYAMNPLLRSGLLLAGCNRRNSGARADRENDGILTAFEVAKMDLTSVQEVVLSACESGLGDVRDGEGVYGLRRAFLLAGARTVISSLWKVDDRETAKFMEALYRSSEVNLAEILRRRALDRLHELRASGVPDHPYLWAPFIAVGELEIRH